MDGVILALDQGTTGTTVLVFAEDGTIIGRAYAELRQYYPHPGWVEQDPKELWQVSRRVVTQALDDAGVAPPPSARSASPISARRRSSGTRPAVNLYIVRSSGRAVRQPTCASGSNGTALRLVSAS